MYDDMTCLSILEEQFFLNFLSGITTFSETVFFYVGMFHIRCRITDNNAKFEVGR